MHVSEFFEIADFVTLISGALPAQRTITFIFSSVRAGDITNAYDRLLLDTITGVHTVLIRT